jgi:hypothetical protein
MGEDLDHPPMCWQVAAASSAGTSHVATGAPCQDSFGVDILETRDGSVLAAIISDGAGSASSSEQGSSKAVEITLGLIRAHFADSTIKSIGRGTATGWVNDVRSAIEHLAEAKGSEIREFACTLLVAVIAKDTAVFIQIGDGAMVIARTNEPAWSPVFWPQHGEYANTTNFVTSQNALEMLDFKCINERVNGLACFSDGIENLVLHQATRTAHAPFFDSMIDHVRAQAKPGIDSDLSRSLEVYLSSEKVCERTDDDKSLILAARLPASAEEQVCASSSS